MDDVYWKSYFYKGEKTEYLVNQIGECFSLKTKRKLVGNYQNGYHRFLLSFLEGKNLFAHRMELETFLPTQEMEFLQVNHKDKNRNSNNLENLEWCSPAENIHHAYYDDKNLEIFCYNKDKEIVEVFASLFEIKEKYNFQIGAIGKSMKKPVKYLINEFYWDNGDHPNFQIKSFKNSGLTKKVPQFSLDGRLIGTTLQLLKLGVN